MQPRGEPVEAAVAGRGHRAAFAAVLDGALEGFAALVEPVKVGDCDAGTGYTGRIDLLAEARD